MLAIEPVREHRSRIDVAELGAVVHHTVRGDLDLPVVSQSIRREGPSEKSSYEGYMRAWVELPVGGLEDVRVTV